MKNWIVCIAILISNSIVYACGPWYPYGEQVRFSLFTPSTFIDNGYNPFNYNADNFGAEEELKPEDDPNTILWKAYCENSPHLKDVFLAVYKLEANELSNANSSNTFVQYLLKNNDKAAINYLKFAKSCSQFSQVTYDPWERGGDHLKKQRNKKIKAALKKSNTESNEMLKKRYEFLAIRLAYYADNESQVNVIYSKYFNTEKIDVIDYWAAYFKLCFEPSSASRNVELAQIFEKCPDKRFAVSQLFDRGISVDKTLNSASTNREKGNVIVMYELRNFGKSVNLLQYLVKVDPSNPQLSFLFLREINKIEDWVLTPKYNLFPPSMYYSYYSEDQKEQYHLRIASDKKYAVEYSEWLKTVRFENDEMRYLQVLSLAYLAQITDNTQDALSKLSNIPISENTAFAYLKDQLELLCKVDASENYAWILDDSKKALLQNNAVANYSNFLFAVGREAEYNKQTSVAACLYSHLNKNNQDWYSEAWKAPNEVSNLYGDFFTEYFFYLDAQYSIEEVQSLINTIENNDFKSPWLTEFVSPDIERLYDLIGTKYLRENELDKAISAFSKVSDATWNKDEYSYKSMLNANPFHADFYTEHEKSKCDTIRYNKYQIATKLQAYIKKGNDVKNPNRAKDYFIAANCYLNMSYYGNSWMMRRYWWSTNEIKSGLVDDKEFARCDLAKKYYKKAYEASTNDMQKALCLRMMGRCEKYALFEEIDYDRDFDYDKYGGFFEYVFTKNKSYKTLEENYPEEYSELISNCETFSEYYRGF
jgi:hypothetical protein